MSRFTDPQMLTFLADTMREIPLLDSENLPWVIEAKEARASYNARFWKTGLLQPSNFLEIINTLKEEHGWKRGNRHASDAPAWIIYAYTENEAGYRVEVSGSRLYSEGRPDGDLNTGIPFFGPPMPVPPKRWVPTGPKAKAWLAACEEHDQKSRNDEW